MSSIFICFNYLPLTPCQITLAFQSQVTEELDSMAVQGIIKTAINTPLDWCQPLVVVGKDTGVCIVQLPKHQYNQHAPYHDWVLDSTFAFKTQHFTVGTKSGSSWALASQGTMRSAKLVVLYGGWITVFFILCPLSSYPCGLLHRLWNAFKFNNT